MINSLILILIFICSAYTTPQFQEKIIYKGQKYSFDTFPLEAFWNYKRPDWLYGVSTASRRGYVGTWKVTNDSLFLNHLVTDPQIFGKNEEAKSLKKMILNELNSSQLPIHASWFSDFITFPLGNQYFQNEFGSRIPKREMLLIFENGILKKKMSKNNLGKYSYSSTDDIVYVVKGQEIMDTTFVDIRNLETKNFKIGQKSRAILNKNGRSYLYVPDTPNTIMDFYEIENQEIFNSFNDGDHVEFGIKKLGSKRGMLFIKVDNPRKLIFGESIHNPKFKPKKEKVEDVEL